MAERFVVAEPTTRRRPRPRPWQRCCERPFDSCYGGADGETEALESSVGAAIGGGARYFFASYNQVATLRQEVSVPAEAGGRTLLIGGDFGGWESQEDHATLEARFFAGAVRHRAARQVRETLNGATSAIASYRWTVDLPKACVLRVARARVFVYTKRDKARLVIHYTTYRPARVSVAYSLRGSHGGLALGSATARFHKAGDFRLPVRLDAAAVGKVRGARSFSVRFRIPKTPGSCGRYYAKRLTIPRKVSGQTVWFQSDSVFAAAG